MTGWRQRVSGERGATLVLVAATMVAVLGFSALAVDVGNLLMIRTESQRAVDAAALACAGHLLIDSDDSLGAANKGIEFAAKNQVNRSPAVIQPGDIELDMPNWTWTARLYNTADRGNAPGTFFARVLGINSMDVVTVARAWAAPANGIESGGTIEDCVLPVGLLDFYDANGDGEYTAGEPQFGFDESDHGKLLKLTVGGSTALGPPSCRTEPYWNEATQTGVWNANPNITKILINEGEQTLEGDMLTDGQSGIDIGLVEGGAGIRFDVEVEDDKDRTETDVQLYWTHGTPGTSQMRIGADQVSISDVWLGVTAPVGRRYEATCPGSFSGPSTISLGGGARLSISGLRAFLVTQLDRTSQLST